MTLLRRIESGAPRVCVSVRQGRRLAGSLWHATVLGVSLLTVSHAHASLLESIRQVFVKANDALPLRIRLGPAGVVTPAQRDSVRRARLAKLPSTGPVEPQAGTTNSVYAGRTLTLQWWIADSVNREVRVHRRDANGSWRSAGRARADLRGQLSWRDSTVLRGRSVEYALELRTPRGIRFVPLPAIFVPGDRSLRVVARTDGAGSALLLLELPTAHPATLELFDVTGRRLGSIDIRGFRSGPHAVPVPRMMLPAAGVYFVRLQQLGSEVDAKLIVPN